MKILACFLTASAIAVSTPAASAAQGAPSYSVPDRTIFIESTNPHLMYWIVGADTLGSPVESVTLESQLWARPGPDFQVVVRRESLLPEASVRTDTFQIDPHGKVLAINSRAPGLHERVDFVPRLPAHPLRIGAQWGDTLRIPGRGPAGEHVYELTRSYRVVRSLDTLDASLVEIEAEGEVHYRDGWWTDSARAVYAWIDVRGSVRERIGFDPSRGQVVYRDWVMDLRGVGGIPDGRGNGKQHPAGLLSASRSRMIAPEAAEALRRRPQDALRPPSQAGDSRPRRGSTEDA